MAFYHIEIQTHRKSPVGIIRSSFRSEGKVMHHTKYKCGEFIDWQIVDVNCNKA